MSSLKALTAIKKLPVGSVTIATGVSSALKGEPDTAVVNNPELLRFQASMPPLGAPNPLATYANFPLFEMSTDWEEPETSGAVTVPEVNDPSLLIVNVSTPVELMAT